MNSSPPQIIEKSVPNLSIKEGETLSLFAKVSSTNESSTDVTWFKNGKTNFQNDNRHELSKSSSKNNEIIEHRFQIEKVCEQDQGDYVLVAKNQNGHVSCQFHVNIVPQGIF